MHEIDKKLFSNVNLPIKHDEIIKIESKRKNI